MAAGSVSTARWRQTSYRRSGVEDTGSNSDGVGRDNNQQGCGSGVGSGRLPPLSCKTSIRLFWVAMVIKYSSYYLVGAQNNEVSIVLVSSQCVMCAYVAMVLIAVVTMCARRHRLK